MIKGYMNELETLQLLASCMKLTQNRAQPFVASAQVLDFHLHQM